MKKKFSININHVIWVLLIACIVLSLTGCGKQEQTVTNLTTEAATEGTTTAATEDTTPVETQPAPLPTTIEKP